MTGVSDDAPQAAPPSAEERALADSEPTEQPEPQRVVVPRWVQLVGLPEKAVALGNGKVTKDQREPDQLSTLTCLALGTGLVGSPST